LNPFVLLEDGPKKCALVADYALRIRRVLNSR